MFRYISSTSKLFSRQPKSFLSTLVYIESNGKVVSNSSRSAITAAKKLGDVYCLVAGEKCADAANIVASLSGVKKVLVADDPSLKDKLPEVYQPLLLACQKSLDAKYVLAGSTAFSRALLPRVAVQLNSSLITDAVGIDGPDVFKRPIYAGNAVLTLKSLDPIRVLTIRETAFEAVPVDANNKAPVEPAPAFEASTGLSSLVSQDLTQSDRPQLNEAKIVIAGGRGLKSGDNFKLLYTLADKLGAAVGATRAAVDAGFVNNAMQIGQTGKVVAPDLYIAVGISGAIQHLAGMKDSKTIVAINTDPEAPIFQVADYGLVEDLFTAIPEITKSV